MKKIIVINGTAGSGKDTFINIFKENTNNIVANISTVDEVKGIAKEMGWDGKTKDSKTRKLLSDLKDLWTNYNDGVFKNITKLADNFLILDNHLLFIHCREPNEIKKIKDRYGDKCCTLLIERNGIEIHNNHADENVLNYDYDHIIKNNKDMSNLKFESKIFDKYLKKY